MITVEGDSENPVLNNVPSDVTYECSSVPTITDPVTATDNCDAVVDVTLSETTIPGVCAASYTLERVWTAVDDCGNSAVATQNITIEDTTDPVLGNVPADTTIICGALPPAAPIVIATDNCDPNVNIVFNETSTNTAPTCADDYVITRTWTATDACGNSSVGEQVITVEGDSENPVLNDCLLYTSPSPRDRG